MISKEELREKRKEAYQKAKAKRDNDPRYQAMKEKAKLDRRAFYQSLKEKHKNAKLEESLEERARKDVVLLTLIKSGPH